MIESILKYGQEEEYFSLNFTGTSITSTNLGIRIYRGQIAKIDWGDGNAQMYSSNISTRTIYFTHVYDNPSTYTIKIYPSGGLKNIQSLFLRNSNLRIQTSEIQKIQYIEHIQGTLLNDILQGDINDLLSLSKLSTVITGGENLTGDINNLISKVGMQNIQIYGGNNITQSSIINDYATSLSNLLLNNIPITMDLTNINTNIRKLYLDVTNVIGDISVFNNTDLVSIHVENNTISGDISNFPSTVIEGIDIRGNNTISGDIADLQMTSIGSFYIGGSNTITGDISLFPQLTGIVNGAFLLSSSKHRIGIVIGGNNTVGGNIAAITVPTNPQYWTTWVLQINGANEINSIDLPNITGWDEIYIFDISSSSNVGLSSSDVDSLLQQLDSAILNPPVISFKTINIGGNSHAPRTSASDAAVLSLEGKNYTVTTN